MRYILKIRCYDSHNASTGQLRNLEIGSFKTLEELNKVFDAAIVMGRLNDAKPTYYGLPFWLEDQQRLIRGIYRMVIDSRNGRLLSKTKMEPKRDLLKIYQDLQYWQQS